ncbi:hypothetical protein Pan153_21700 [Gimesia panareensis]|uniref:Uncharacterized protein n=1 Tax=Gimesia panareensis TaxID=2527978 RepID=A0A518FMI4_9PLAN|nr:hypothetical protein [Gimesia panareensis]QDV17517.1 hypothetical protein Pan153_21700 [Gimesia panareensis]
MQNSTIILLIVVAVVAMVLGGWISFTDSGDSASMTIHKDKMKQDTEAAVEQGEEFLKDTTDKGKQLMDQETHKDQSVDLSTDSELEDSTRKP